MSWYIYKGKDLKRNHTTKFPFYRPLNQQYKPTDLVFHSELYYAETNVAPTYPGPTVKMSCRLRSDLRGLSKQALGLKGRTGADGKPYYDLSYNLVLSAAEANLTFSLEINGNVLSSVDASYV